MRWWENRVPKTDLEIKIEEIIEGNPQGLRAYLVSEGYQNSKLIAPSDMMDATRHLLKCNKSHIPKLMTLHPDYTLFSDIYQSVNQRSQMEEVSNIAPSQVNVVEINNQPQQPSYEQPQQPSYLFPEVAERLRQIMEQKQDLTRQVPQLPQNKIKEEEFTYLDVQDVCIYGMKVKHWLVCMVALFIATMIITFVAINNHKED